MAFTVYLTFGAWLFLPTLDAPAAMTRAALRLCGCELGAAAIWAFGSEDCDARPCGMLPEAARSAAALEIPVATGLAFVVAAAYGLRAARAC